jgi:hypothetical protein
MIAFTILGGNVRQRFGDEGMTRLGVDERVLCPRLRSPARQARTLRRSEAGPTV